MFRLLVLGSARIEGPDGRLAGEVAQRHRLALLACLAAANGSRLPREKLVSTLWPEQGDKEGRHLLNVSVHVIRKAIGDGVLVSEGNELRLDSAVLTSDIGAFRAALSGDDMSVAVSHYAGPFLDGFFLDGSPEFDHWQATERARLEAEFTKAVASLAEQAESQNTNWKEAANWWQLLWHRAPEREETTLRLMQALELSGDRAGALRVADAHARLLQDEFGASPSPNLTALADRMRMVPASFAYAEEQGSGTISSDNSARPQAPSPHRFAIKGVLLASAVVLVAIVLALGPWNGPDTRSVAVLPFADLTPEGDRAYVGDGITEELLNALARIPGLEVAARSSSFQFRDPGVDIREVGSALSVDAVVEGSVRLDGNRLRVTAQLIDTKSGYHLWSEQYDRRVEDIFAVQEEIARTVARELGARLGRAPGDSLVRRVTDNADAYDFYLRGRYAWNRRTTEGMWDALRYFEEAIALDSQFAAAYAGLSDAWQLLPDYGSVNARQGLANAKTAALRAIALDSTLAEAYASLGAILDDYDRDRAGAEQAYRKAILLDPEYATARQWLAIHLADEGREREAAGEIESARRLEPSSRIINTAVGAIRYFARDYASAIAEYRAVVERSPDFALGWALMGRVYLVQGRPDSAVAILKRSVELSDGDPSYEAVYAAALAASGQVSEGRERAERLREVHINRDGYVPYCELASAFVYLGDDAAALDLFERGFDERDPALKHLAVEPLYDRIRGHPRFRALMKRAGHGDVATR